MANKRPERPKRPFRQRLKTWAWNNRLRLVGLLLLIIWYWNYLPDQLFDDPTCTVLLDRNGELLGARIADDGQWRFPPSDSVPEKFEQAILHFEDKWFHYHPGVNPISTARALWDNVSEWRVVSGGSTISMQVIRLSRKGQRRTFLEKLSEIVQATRMEWSYTKDEILAMYASHAPFGGNVVGLEAAAWRYYGRPAADLSWGESATLAVLPNAPALIYPGRNQDALRNKRNRLLNTLWEEEVIDSVTCSLAKEEPLPGTPYPLPGDARHLLQRAAKDGLKGLRVKTTLDQTLQYRAREVLERNMVSLRANEIHNAAALIMDVETGEVRSYLGNVRAPDGTQHGQNVDCITAPRSTGSILKPFLYAALMKEGELLPKALVPDVPTHISGYAPENFDRSYAGAVPADAALARSLNVPAVRLLQQHGIAKFHHLLRELGLTTITRHPDHYGLSLVLGGAEATLWDLCGAYAGMSRTLQHYAPQQSRYQPTDIRPPTYLPDSTVGVDLQNSAPLTAGPIWSVYEAMLEVTRPVQDQGWQSFGGSQPIAWKTGTSFGFRDAWAIGTTPRYVVGVWVGNADGEGRPGLTGVGSAAPILFELFRLLDQPADWFEMPYDDLRQIPTCRQSGLRTGRWCPEIDSTWVPVGGLNASVCGYHQPIHTDLSTLHRVHLDCVDQSEMKTVPWFILPPVQSWYYRRNHPSYRPIPPFLPGCEKETGIAEMEVIYPSVNTQVYIPLELDGKRGQAIFEVAHRDPATTIFWHLDGTYQGSTQHYHQMGMAPESGNHVLTLVDEHGATVERRFEVMDR